MSGSIVFREDVECNATVDARNDKTCGRPATRFVILSEVTQATVDFVVCSNCDHRLCPNGDCAQPLTDVFAETCAKCGADVRLVASPQTKSSTDEGSTP